MEIIERFNNIEQYKESRRIGLFPKMINGRTALVRKIDLNYVDKNGMTNLQRIMSKKAPLDPTGIPYELHHIGQSNDSPLAILTHIEHMGEGNNKIWPVKTSGFDNPSSQKAWATIKANFWKDYAMKLISGGI